MKSKQGLLDDMKAYGKVELGNPVYLSILQCVRDGEYTKQWRAVIHGDEQSFPFMLPGRGGRTTLNAALAVALWLQEGATAGEATRRAGVEMI
jgi:hypothetical protein